MSLTSAALPLRTYRAAGPALAVALSLAAVGGLALAGEQGLALAVPTLIFVLFAASLNLLVGTGGMVSMGHAALFATGGYVAALLAKHGFDMASAALAGIAAAALMATAMAAICVGREPTAFIMLTLALAQLVYIVIWKWREVTGGDDGLIGFAPPEWLRGTGAYCALTVLAVAGALAALLRLTRSPFGAALRAVRDNAGRAAFAGLNVKAIQIAAFAISGAMAGLAGVLLAFFQRGMFVESAGFATSTNALLVCVLGGTRSFAGPIIGALVFRAVATLAPSVTSYWLSMLGVIVVLVGLYRPEGLAGLLLRPAARR